MPDFTTIFPAETITEIISCLEQKDCVECMSVCHQWYNIIPNYIHSTEVWRKLTIAPDSWNKTNNAMIQCLGPHVKKVSIYSQDSCTILEQLDKHHCGIKSLEIYKHQVPTERQGRVVTDDDIKLPVTIGEFSLTITELFIHSHTTDVSLTLILDYLPTLTHLSLTFHNDAPKAPSDYDDIKNSHGLSNKNLIFLRLDNTLNFNSRIQPVLSRCPNIRFLMITSDMEKNEIHDIPTRHFHTALELCPDIHYILFNVDPLEGSQMKQWLQLSREQVVHNSKKEKAVSNNNNNEDNKYITRMVDEQQKHLHHKLLRGLVFGASDQDELIQIYSVLENSRSWLEYLRIECIGTGLDGFLTRKALPQLKTLEIFGVFFPSEDWLDILDLHPQLEHLETELWFHDSEELDNVMEVIGKKLKRLKRLVLYCPAMATLRLDLCDRKIDFLCHAKQLEALDLPGIPVSDHALLRIAQELPQLQSLYLSGKNQKLTENGLVAFAGKIKESKEKTRIQCLELHDIEGVTNRVLEHLGCIESLTLLCVTRNKNISDTGVRAFFFGKSYEEGNDNSKSYNLKKKFEVDLCPGISEENTLVSQFRNSY